jgi:hypothetical protein
MTKRIDVFSRNLGEDDRACFVFFGSKFPNVSECAEIEK